MTETTIVSQITLSPHSQQPYVTRQYPSIAELDEIVAKSVVAQKEWKKVSVDDRIKIGWKFLEEFKKLGDEVPEELTLQMGRPISQGKGEVNGVVARSEYLLSIAKQQLSDIEFEDDEKWPKATFKRFIRREPWGVVFVIAPWNFPYLTSINSVLPALLSGNSVLIKPSPHTPVTAERLLKAFTSAGLPQNALQVLHLPPDLIQRVVADPRVGFVSFTGSVRVGREIEKVVADSNGRGQGGFKGLALELGGKDAAYVREDADIDYTVAELIDGAFFNSGQSCCSVERIYVHESVYWKFLQPFADAAKKLVLGDPTDPNTTLGPVIDTHSAAKIKKQISDAIHQGANSLVPEGTFKFHQPSTPFVAPQILVDVTHSMDVMTEETFGPVVGIIKVQTDAEALQLINQSTYGLTTSIWTKNEDKFMELANEVESGTVYMNRCDYLDPALAWNGWKNSGRGVSLSRFGFDQLTRPKSYHIKRI